LAWAVATGTLVSHWASAASNWPVIQQNKRANKIFFIVRFEISGNNGKTCTSFASRATQNQPKLGYSPYYKYAMQN
jgi:hypothetical protein